MTTSYLLLLHNQQYHHTKTFLASFEIAMTAAHPAPTKLRAAGSTKTLALCILFAFYISGDVVGIQKRLRSFGVPETEQKNHVRIGTSAAVAKGKTTFVEETKWPDFNPSKDLNFAVIGWPKTGTSFLLNVLGNHPEVTMPNTEFCDIVQDGGEKNLTDWMENKVREMNNSSSVQKFGIKCPGMIRQTRSIENLMKLSDSTRLVVGVRHPVLWFESFYNVSSDACMHYGMRILLFVPHDILHA